MYRCGESVWLAALIQQEISMTKTRSVSTLLASAGVALALLTAAGAAQARSDVNWSIGVGVPGVVVGARNGGYGGGYYAPAPVYSAPPVYYAPPRPVYYAPPPVYYAPPRPVYYAPPAPVYYGGYGHGHRHHGRGDGRRWDR